MKVNFTFDRDFKRCIESIPNNIKKIEAIDDDSLDIAKRYRDYHNDTESITGEENANVGKSIHPSHRHGKIYEPIEKLKSYEMLYVKMKEMYGRKRADEALVEVIKGSLAINDSENIDLPYCVAFSSSHLMKEGRSYFKEVPNEAPTNARSYLNMTTEAMFDASAEFMGATVVFDILIGMAYYTKKSRASKLKAFKNIDKSTAIKLLAPEMVTTKRTYEEAVDYLDSNSNNTEDVVNLILNYDIVNLLQAWVHLMGNKFRKSYQSIFTNLNLFSPRIIKDNFDYYEYPNGDKIDDDYIAEIVTIELLFSKFFSQGIKGKFGHKVVAMPVVSLMIPKDDVGSEQLQVKDDEFIDDILRYFSRYNNMNVYRGLKLAMCCFDGSQKAILRDNEGLEQIASFKELYEKYGEIEIETRGTSLEWEKAKLVKIPRENKDMYKIDMGLGVELLVTEDHIHPTMEGDFTTLQLKSRESLGLDNFINSFKNLHDKTALGWTMIQSINKYDTVDDYVYCFEMKDKTNPYFVLPNDMVTHNCRITVDRPEHKVNVNSLGVVTGNSGNDAVGSIRVVTGGLSSIAKELKLSSSTQENLENFKKLLSYKLDLCKDILEAQRKIIYQRHNEGLYNFSRVGWVKFEKLASTLGGVGIFEMAKLICNGDFNKKYTAEEKMVAEEVQALFDAKCSQFTEETGNTFNMELSIPAESMAFRFKDREDINYGKDERYSELSNQFTPLTLDIDIVDRLTDENYLSSVISPTGICHINIEGKITPEQNIRLHRTTWKNYPDVEHYAFNSPICECENMHLEPDSNDGKCVVCGGNIVSTTSRSIGYFKDTETAFGARRREEFKRRKFKRLND